MKIIIIFFFMIISLHSTSQVITLKWLQKLAYSTSMDDIDKELRTNKFVYESNYKFRDGYAISYFTPLKTLKGYERILIIKDKDLSIHNYRIIYISTFETIFNSLKEECDTMLNVKKIDEIIDEGKFKRVYTDGFYYYDFTMANDSENIHNYSVSVFINK